MEKADPYRPQDLGFSIAFGADDIADPSIAYYTAKAITYTTEVDSTLKSSRTKVSRTLGIDQCGTKYFNYSSADTVKYGISDYMCLTENDYELQGDYYSDNYEYLEIKMWKCQNNSKNTASTNNASIVCKSQATIDNWVNSQTLSFAFINSVFLIDQYFPTIKSYVDDSLFFELNADLTKKADFYVQQSEADTTDQVLAFGDPLTTLFANVENIRNYEGIYKPTSGYVAAVYIRYDKGYDIYTRTVYGILDWLSDMGGLAGSLMAIFGLFVTYFANRLFVSKIVQRVY